MTITLLTDFGLGDHYVGTMKGVMLNIDPDARIVDITHEIVPENIDEAAHVLKNAYAYFPEDTLHVVVVDPGVGSKREILAVKAGRTLFLAPDNGVLKHIFYKHPDHQVFRVTNSDYFLDTISPTFHGRDIFAPVAAHLSLGVSLNELGESFNDYIRGNIRKPVVENKKIIGEIVYIDRFGNAVTNIEESLVKKFNAIEIRMKGYLINLLSRTYADVPIHAPLAVIGSSGALEISVNQGNARDVLNLRTGDRVTVTFE